jgi:hypothetical protein
MLKFAIIAAAGALSVSAHAAASPFNLTASSEKDDSAETQSRSILDIALDATASAFGFVFTAGEKDEDIVLKYYNDVEGCEAKDAGENEIVLEETEKKAPVGPEPMYFGF